ncbi:hypothetical protein LCGC14_2238320, partial [marine sediment metagenome]
MEKRVTFKGWLLPICLLLPQLVITAVFFFYPAAQAVWQSLFIPDPFGLSMRYVGLGNFEYLLTDPYYLASFKTTAVFSILVTVVSMAVALYLAVLADRLIKGSGTYRTLLIWPYAVAPAVAGVLWLFMFNTRVGVVSWYLGLLGYDWNHVLNEGEAMGLVVVASAWGRISYNFLFFLAGLQAIPKSVIEAAAIDGARFWTRFRTIVWPLLSPTTFFLLVVNIVYAFFETFGGFEEFSAQMAEVSEEDWAAKIFSAKTVEDFNALVSEATGLLDAHQATLQLESDAWAGVEEAADKYGLTLEEMGPRFAARELTEKAGELFQDFQLLIAAGADLNAVLEKMGPEVSDFVNQSIRAGVAVPQAMEPMLQQMADAGTLIDADGNAITNLAEAGITFAQTMDEMFLGLMESVESLVNALLGINDINVSPNVRIPGGGASVPTSAQQGFFTPAVPTSGAQDGGQNLRIHGGEEVSVTPATFGGDGGGEQQLSVVVNIGSEKLYDMITKATKTGQVRVFPD